MMRRIAGIAVALWISTIGWADAGSLKVVSWFTGELLCTYGSGTYQPNTGQVVRIGHGAIWTFSAGDNGVQNIDWLKCGDALARNLKIETKGPDHTIVIPARPRRALNVLLYPYLPYAADTDLQNLQNLIATAMATYGDPEVMLNVVLRHDDNLDIYADKNYASLFGSSGFNIVELDMIMLPEALNGGHIRPWGNNANPRSFWPGAMQTVTSGNQVWGVPHWLCSDFLFSYDPTTTNIHVFADLVAYLKKQPTSNHPLLAGSFNGKWRITSLYLNAYAGIHGYDKLDSALKAFDPAAVKSIAELTGFCEFAGSSKCINHDYKSAGDKHNVAEMDVTAFATGQSNVYVGFSEQSFYVLNVGAARTEAIYASAVPYGDKRQPLVFADAYVANAAACAAASPCDDDAWTFVKAMNSPQIMNTIIYNWEARGTAPPRRLLPASLSFWNQPLVRADGLYGQFSELLQRARGFPNSVSLAQRDELNGRICSELKKLSPGYVCP